MPRFFLISTAVGARGIGNIQWSVLRIRQLIRNDHMRRLLPCRPNIVLHGARLDHSAPPHRSCLHLLTVLVQTPFLHTLVHSLSRCFIPRSSKVRCKYQSLFFFVRNSFVGDMRKVLLYFGKSFLLSVLSLLVVMT